MNVVVILVHCRVLQQVFEANNLPAAICSTICTGGAIGFVAFSSIF